MPQPFPAAIFALEAEPVLLETRMPRPPRAPAPGIRPKTGARKARSGCPSVCPPGSLPDGALCVALPNGDDEGGDELIAMAGAHFDKRGRYDTYDQIPRRPDRSADYAVYQYPIPIAAGPASR